MGRTKSQAVFNSFLAGVQSGQQAVGRGLELKDRRDARKAQTDLFEKTQKAREEKQQEQEDALAKKGRMKEYAQYVSEFIQQGKEADQRYLGDEVIAEIVNNQGETFYRILVDQVGTNRADFLMNSQLEASTTQLDNESYEEIRAAADRASQVLHSNLIEAGISEETIRKRYLAPLGALVRDTSNSMEALKTEDLKLNPVTPLRFAFDVAVGGGFIGEPRDLIEYMKERNPALTDEIINADKDEEGFAAIFAKGTGASEKSIIAAARKANEEQEKIALEEEIAALNAPMEPELTPMEHPTGVPEERALAIGGGQLPEMQFGGGQAPRGPRVPTDRWMDPETGKSILGGNLQQQFAQDQSQNRPPSSQVDSLVGQRPQPAPANPALSQFLQRNPANQFQGMGGPQIGPTQDAAFDLEQRAMLRALGDSSTDEMRNSLLRNIVGLGGQ